MRVILSTCTVGYHIFIINHCNCSLLFPLPPPFYCWHILIQTEGLIYHVGTIRICYHPNKCWTYQIKTIKWLHLAWLQLHQQHNNALKVIIDCVHGARMQYTEQWLFLLLIKIILSLLSSFAALGVATPLAISSPVRR